MALYSVVKNHASAAQDLNQVVNLLNGTTTSTRMTVANRISAQLSGATSPSALVGGSFGAPYGSGTFAVGDLSSDSYYSLLWTCYGATSGPYPQGTWQSAGTGGMAARWHQGNPQTLSANQYNLIYLDTQDFDPWGMYSTASHGFVVPLTGTWAFAGAAHRRVGSADDRVMVTLFKNGVEAARGFDSDGPNGSGGGDVAAELSCTSGDVVSLRMYIGRTGTAGQTDTTLTSLTYLTAQFVGSQLQ
jgi:hypothetical protein